MRLPELFGQPIEVVFRPRLTNYRGKLLSGGARGFDIHAASFIRARRIVLDTALRGNQQELNRILVHELFHFAWVRLGNQARRSWERLVSRQRDGELGWSAELRQAKLRASDRRRRTRFWREYACESFCDTAAWLFTRGRHGEVTLDPAYREDRRRWFIATGLARRISV